MCQAGSQPEPAVAGVGEVIALEVVGDQQTPARHMFHTVLCLVLELVVHRSRSLEE